MLPNFLIIGAEKAATTWLARCLAEHPSTYLPAQKEIFFFSSRFDRGLDWYRSQFAGWKGQRRVGEATPVYLSNPTAAARIRVLLGEIDLVVSLRQPVDRAYSAFWHNLRRGRLPPDADFEACMAADACEIRSRGEYPAHLGRYLEVMPRHRLLVLVYEQLRDQPERELARCLEFLDLERPFRPSVLHARLNEGGKAITSATGPVRAVRSVVRGAVLGTIRRGLLPESAERRLVPVAERVFGRLAGGLGRASRPYGPLPEALRWDLMERYYPDQVPHLEALLAVDLRNWWTPAADGRIGADAA